MKIVEKLRDALTPADKNPRKSAKGFFFVAKEAVKSWNAHDPFRQSAVIAYYAIFSLPALLVVITTVAGAVFGKDEVMERISEQIGETMGAGTGEQIETMVAKAGETKDSRIATIIGVATIIFGATGVFAQLQKTLNIIWGVKITEKKKMLKMLKDRLFSFGLVLSVAFMLLISFVFSSALTSLSDIIESWFSEGAVVLVFILNFIISSAIIAVLFALMFKILPDVAIGWRDVIMGSIVTAVLFSLGKIALSIYFGKSQPDETYGAAGSIILILLWVSYSGMIFFYGAEFTKQNWLARRGKVIAGPGADTISEECEV